MYGRWRAFVWPLGIVWMAVLIGIIGNYGRVGGTGNGNGKVLRRGVNIITGSNGDWECACCGENFFDF